MGSLTCDRSCTIVLVVFAPVLFILAELGLIFYIRQQRRRRAVASNMSARRLHDAEAAVAKHRPGHRRSASQPSQPMTISSPMPIEGSMPEGPHLMPIAQTQPSAGAKPMPIDASDAPMPMPEKPCPALSRTDRFRVVIGLRPKCPCRNCRKHDNARHAPGEDVAASTAPGYHSIRGLDIPLHPTHEELQRELPQPAPIDENMPRNTAQEVLPIYIRNDTVEHDGSPDAPPYSSRSATASIADSDYSRSMSVSSASPAMSVSPQVPQSKGFSPRSASAGPGPRSPRRQNSVRFQEPLVSPSPTAQRQPPQGRGRVNLDDDAASYLEQDPSIALMIEQSNGYFKSEKPKGEADAMMQPKMESSMEPAMESTMGPKVEAKMSAQQDLSSTIKQLSIDQLKDAVAVLEDPAARKQLLRDGRLASVLELDPEIALLIERTAGYFKTENEQAATDLKAVGMEKAMELDIQDIKPQQPAAPLTEDDRQKLLQDNKVTNILELDPEIALLIERSNGYFKSENSLPSDLEKSKDGVEVSMKALEALGPIKTDLLPSDDAEARKKLLENEKVTDILELNPEIALLIERAGGYFKSHNQPTDGEQHPAFRNSQDNKHQTDVQVSEVSDIDNDEHLPQSTYERRERDDDEVSDWERDDPELSPMHPSGEGLGLGIDSLLTPTPESRAVSRKPTPQQSRQMTATTTTTTTDGQPSPLLPPHVEDQARAQAHTDKPLPSQPINGMQPPHPRSRNNSPARRIPFASSRTGSPKLRPAAMAAPASYSSPASPTLPSSPTTPAVAQAATMTISRPFHAPIQALDNIRSASPKPLAPMQSGMPSPPMSDKAMTPKSTSPTTHPANLPSTTYSKPNSKAPSSPPTPLQISTANTANPLTHTRSRPESAAAPPQFLSPQTRTGTSYFTAPSSPSSAQHATTTHHRAVSSGLPTSPRPSHRPHGSALLSPRSVREEVPLAIDNGGGGFVNGRDFRDLRREEAPEPLIVGGGLPTSLRRVQEQQQPAQTQTQQRSRSLNRKASSAKDLAQEYRGRRKPAKEWVDVPYGTKVDREGREFAESARG